jgi:hypothetical protein
VDGVSIAPVSGSVTIPGFQGGQTYSVQWWDTYTPVAAQRITRTERVIAQPDGDVVLNVSNLVNDSAVEIFQVTGADSTTTYLPIVLKGD